MTYSNPDFSNPEAQIDGILPKGPYPPCLCMADRALFAGYPPNEGKQVSSGQLPSSAPMSPVYFLMASCQMCSVPGVTTGTVADHSNDIMQKRHNCSVTAMETHFFCIKPSICGQVRKTSSYWWSVLLVFFVIFFIKVDKWINDYLLSTKLKLGHR